MNKDIIKILKKIEKRGGRVYLDEKKGFLEVFIPHINEDSSLDVKLDEDEIVIGGSDTNIHEKCEIFKKLWDEILKRGNTKNKSPKDVAIV